MFYLRIREKSAGLVVLSWTCLAVLCSASTAPCDKTRRVFTDPSGIITDGPSNSNYTQDSHCEWLIKAANKSQYITLSFIRMGTECSYDYVFVYDGDSFDAPLLGSFSGKTEPQNVTASSGFMLILLYSDTNYVLDGFRATYAIHNCPNNCTGRGLCMSNKCFCVGTWGGPDCSLELCPNGCSGNGQCKGDGCICKKGYSGSACSLKTNDKEGNSWHWLSHTESGMSKRAAHTAVYVNHTDSLYVFGGYDLNRVLGLLEIYKFSTSQWRDENGKVLRRFPTNEELDKSLLTLFTKGNLDGSWHIGNRSSLFNLLLNSFSHNDKTSLPLMYTHSSTPYSESYLQFTDRPELLNYAKSNSSKPEPRYGHAACAYDAGFILYGGKLSDGSLSSELWYYDALLNSWTLRAVNSSFTPPGLTRHTLTAVGNDLYLFGGSTVDGEFSSSLYKISLGSASTEYWERVAARGGKELDVRVVAHTAVYHHQSNSILVYGGVVASVARFSKLSDRMFAFDLEHKHWSEIHYPRAHLRDTYVPRERAFHTATIVGNYLIVFGGYSHRHNREEICYDGQMYLYHLGCHSWIPLDVLGKTRKYYPKKQGVFAHAAALKPPSTLLIVGGYHGNVNGDLLAYVVPSWHAGITAKDPESACPRHRSQPECLADPECGWCSADDICYGRTVGSNCTTNLQSLRCGGICPALGDCHSCLIHGPPLSRNSSRTPLTSVSTKLGLYQCSWCVQNARCHHKDDNYGVCGEDTPSESPGWWGATGVEVTEPDMCKVLDKRPGLTFLRYQQPADWNHPDGVLVVNATTVDWGTGGGSNHIFSGSSEAKLRGWLHIPTNWNGTGETLHLCAGYSNLSLSLGDNPEPIANLTAQPSACSPVEWPLLNPGRLSVDMYANDSLHTGLYPSHHHAKMELLHNKSQESAKVFTFEFLEPYSNGECSNYDNCLLCLSDAACGWCEVTNRCEQRDVDEKVACANDGEWRYLTLQPAACPNCSNYISCERCVSGNYCEWWADEARCARRGRASGAIVDATECPAPCRMRLDCEHCLDERGRCVWCEATRQCFSFSVYTSEYQFGLCREWLDRASSPTDEAARKSGQCKSCQAHVQCSTCLRSMGCGWCHSHGNPINGVCTEGDFTRSHVDCASLLNVSSTDAGWAYAQCPDVDECGLGLHDCHEHAICNNTHGSYTCKCKQGYIGDGKKICMRTCYNNCIHGYCLGPPQYKCHCDLGWTGADCSINCGCHNHSTCKTGVGRCDECQDWTEGEFCESCKPGSHGNATTGQGCRRCDCNDHGDESRGVCDVTTGDCICKDNTEGQNCERCKPKFYGDPRHGGRCYYQCEPRGMLNASQTEGIGSFKSDPDVTTLGPAKECLWIISSEGIKDAIIQFTVNATTFNVPCEQNAVYVYDGLGGVPDLTNNQQSQLLGVFCNGASSGVVEARSGNLTVHYKQSQPDQGFEGVYNVLACESYCSWPRVCNNRHCVCRDGYGGFDCDVEICRNNCSMHLNGGVCDTNYGRCLCSEGFGGDDCSIKLDKSQLVFTELFNSDFLSDGLDHLRKTLPRFGHSLVADRRGLWMFGGYSLSHGPLNDIRFYDTKNNTWMQVTVEATPDAKMPEGRYFHAAEIYHSKQNIYIYGGLSLQDKSGDNKTLQDFWQFSLKEQRWSQIKSKEENPPPLAGHTLTMQKYQDYESLVLIGGFSLEEGFMSDMWEFDLDHNKWIKLVCTGAKPVGLIGHSTVYHAPSQSLYVFGGIMYTYNGTMISNKLFSFHYPTKSWSELPVFPSLNNPYENLPRASFLHSAVTTNDYMIVFGGRTVPDKRSNSLVAYIYKCNQWVKLSKGTSVLDHPPPRTMAHAMAIDMESESDWNVYIVGGWTGSANCQVTRITLPDDLCSLWSSSKMECRSHMGCSFCSTGDYTKCYSVDKPGCEGSDRISTNAGSACDAELISRRSCENFTTCTSCLAAWPMYPEEKPACRWCETCAAGVGECVPTDESCTSIKCNAGTRYISNSEQCPELRCVYSDCDKCITNQCAWTRLADRTAQMTTITEDPNVLYNWTCATTEEPGRANVYLRAVTLKLGHNTFAINKDECPVKCHHYTDCQTCLSSEGAEGGASECHWASYIGTCISPAYQPLYCAGGTCGLVLTKADKNKCPAPCNTFEQCSECLHHSHCGWCAVDGANGEGVCTEGSIDSPLDYLTRTTCAAVYTGARDANNTDDTFSWHYTRCPPENECENNHHQCKADSEVCHDLPFGYECVCGSGHKRQGGVCAAVCTQGCVRGACVQPNVCRCDFGYVGANCTIQCQCNGHAHCEGPDKLDQCIECHNNTMGSQCEKCKPNFVGDPTDNGQCIPCSVFCHGHTSSCANDGDISQLPRDLSSADLEEYYREGSAKARCLRCANNTDGPRCERCIEGYFRGSEDFRDPCRPCECHGHGDTCDPVTGEKCNCGNNTESDASCAAGGKNSAAECWRNQCVKCRDLYMGDPRNGHQCYKTLNIENKLCFDDECKIKPRPLYPGQTVFVAINPRYMNVDIRVMVDVTQGAVDLYMSPNDSSFVVSVNSSTGAHAVELDPSYYKHEPFRRMPSFDDHVPERSRTTWYHDKTEYALADYTAKDLATYVTVDKRNILLRVRNLRNRLVLTLPQNVHDLTHTKFYLIVRARSSDEGAAGFGVVFFRQDQLHIDLFVFFSVFFSCFFLFLAACVVAWKAKQAADVRRARRRHVVEMLHMAKRPFAAVRVVVGGAALRRDLRPVAIEPTADARAAVTTVLVRLPGGSRAPVRMSLASALVLVARAPPRPRPRALRPHSPRPNRRQHS
ncbi:multiple epidermal growth factor-like domains protein 8 isoform X2 [Aricia agestis]|uniref:multiple epidermal growth factor-like domains protein 8 isoform X2 n=1 Tax=Aricia agestis TaxID=91739 RepID=UPI001C203C32|nr:multiple epidermal growth factor-like domains protein 8 isoform X2 [Aricia agestis]